MNERCRSKKIHVSLATKIFGQDHILNITVLIAAIVISVAGIFIYKRFQTIKLELQSCRSSCSDSD